MRRILPYAAAALVAAAYAAITMALAPISYGVLQFRVSEALCVLPALLPCTAWGLFAGCAVANLLSGGAIAAPSVGDLPDTAEICGCNGVCKGTILQAVTEKGPGVATCDSRPSYIACTAIAWHLDNHLPAQARRFHRCLFVLHLAPAVPRQTPFLHGHVLAGNG